MNVLDFISSTPRMYIFQKGTNKTNLGGILTFIYLIVLILLIVTYLFDYFYHEKYEFNYFYQHFINKTYIKELKGDKEFNPKTDFTFLITDTFGEIMSDNFSFEVHNSDDKTFEKEIQIGEIINKKVDEFYILVKYKCPDKNCTFKTKKLKRLLNTKYFFFYFIIQKY